MMSPTVPPLTPQEFELFRAFIEQACAISLDSGKMYLLETRLRSIVLETRSGSYGDLYRKVKEQTSLLLRNKIIDAITTNETLWFRDQGPYTVLLEVFLPEMLAQARKGRQRVRIWSAACSTGQEPYSVAMVIDEFCQRAGQGALMPAQFEIVATDISTQALAVARLGAYDEVAMKRGMNDSHRARYFKQNQRYWIVDPRLKRMIQFREFNLQDEFAPLGLFDAILCRNVAIYFSQDFKVNLFEKLRRSLMPGGLFFLGSSETLLYINNSFKPRTHKNSTYYVA